MRICYKLYALLLCLAAAGILFFTVPHPVMAQETKTITLPKPDKAGGKPLMEALALRQSAREFSEKAVSEQDLSNLLWATWGINRPNGMRTAPTSRNMQNIEVYVALESGVWKYMGESHTLEFIIATDIRQKTETKAPVVLMYAAPEHSASEMHVGSLYQNAGLYCASAGLINVVQSSTVKKMEGAFPLPKDYSVRILHPIGWAQ